MALIEIDEIDGLPNLNMVIFHGYVKEPDGKLVEIKGYTRLS